MGITKKYWKGLEELKETPEFIKHKEQEFPNQQTIEDFLSDDKLNETSTARRDFLKFLGFSVAAATLAACEAPVTKAVPYVMKPEDVTPGMATWYASTYYDGVSYASILVKTREGRPIFIKGNKDFGFTKGSTNPQIIASVLGLYDSERLTGATANGKATTWSKVDDAIKGDIKKAKKVVLLSNSIISPSLNKAIDELATSLNVEGGTKFEHITYDAVSYSAIREANFSNFGAAIIPSYDFSKAKTIVSVDADFMSTWLLSNEYAKQYGETRNPDAEWMSKFIHFESVLSITGSNADCRGMIKPSEQASVLAYIIKGLGGSTSVASDLKGSAKEAADQAIASLKKSKKESLVVCGSNNVGLQLLTNKLNNLLGVYGTTIDLDNSVELFQANDAKVNKLVADVINGKGPDVLLMYGVNPVYTLPNGADFAKGLKDIKTTVSFASHADETATLATYVCPDHHGLESWNDFKAKANEYGIAQPTIRPLHETASALETFLVWNGKASRGGKDSTVAYDYIKATFATNYPTEDFAYTTHNSCIQATIIPGAYTFKDSQIKGLPKGGDLEVVLYQKAGIGNGMYASNPWLQELPDPITKVTWDNYITMNPLEMEKGGFATTYDQENGLNLATVTVNGKSVTLPVYPLPGQALKTVGIALGYGRGANGEAIGRAAFQTKEYGGYAQDNKGNKVAIGANVYPFSSFENGTYNYDAVGKLTKAEGTYPIAATQIHHTVMGRYSIVRETTLGIYKESDRTAYNPIHELQKLDEHGNHVKVPMGEFDLWDAHPIEKIGHRWGMTIDLSSCIGCGSCLIACQSENNVPVVGKDEVRRGREMHWLRIDRYFASDEEAVVGTRKDKETFSYDKAELAAENPKVVHMPLMCHHCNHAPCETVCPVAATTHSNEGLNQMTYNRCIGTRYCANNCPYKVRRFNWFNYPSYKKFTEINPAQDDLGRMVLNPDVTVRTRGVMEKCSFCVQRIQATKLVAKKELRPVLDGELATACSDSCPTNAIIVGDWNDIRSNVRKSSADTRSYQALEEVGVKPNIWYKVKVRNEDNNLLEKLQVSTLVHHEDKKAHH
ncbi:MAG: 4Fe-4S dicluster domain-containing protein [Flavobacteriales bacterium]|nr:4Fe-4S dicluster domain-containing protein [Crocinitomicaceae bacterium]NBX79131.1 4Fe-4S dicluster domain-containing protein [Flavobacteriales bacterium]NCA19604.1 4Fe-4S dicluster domain-containing protein [Crocinitomicaceae bacterium]